MEGQQREQGGKKASFLASGFTGMHLHLLFWVVSASRGLSGRLDLLSPDHLQQGPTPLLSQSLCLVLLPLLLTCIGTFMTVAVETGHPAVTLPQNPHGGLLAAGNSWCLV